MARRIKDDLGIRIKYLINPDDYGFSLPKIFLKFIKYVNNDLDIDPKVYITVKDPAKMCWAEFTNFDEIYLYCVDDKDFDENQSIWMSNYAHEARHFWHVATNSLEWFETYSSWIRTREILVKFERLENPTIDSTEAINAIVDIKYGASAPDEVDANVYAKFTVYDFFEKLEGGVKDD